MRQPTGPAWGVLVILGVVAACALPPGVPSASAQVKRTLVLQRCGTPEASHAEAQGVTDVLRRWSEENAAGPAGGVIRVAFHVLTANGAGDVTDERLMSQIAELNRKFEGTGYRFELARVDRRDEPAWYRMAPGSAAERRAKEALAIEPARHLNIYVCSPTLGLSWATYPWSAPEGDAMHGVVLDQATLPGGDSWRGRDAAHEVGHYLGLVDADDETASGFAATQTARMRAVVAMYRPSLFSAPARGIGKPEIVPAAGAEPEDGRVLSYRGAFPNPFRAETALRFTLPTSQPVSLRIYSVTGQLVRTLVDATLPPGDHSAMFRGDDLPSGAYFAMLRVGAVQMSRTIMLVR
jgi:hypothetical protein